MEVKTSDLTFAMSKKNNTVLLVFLAQPGIIPGSLGATSLLGWIRLAKASEDEEVKNFIKSKTSMLLREDPAGSELEIEAIS